MSNSTDEIIDCALAGESLNLDDTTTLYSTETFSKEAYHLQWAARRMMERACGGHGVVYAQIGIDDGPCPENCQFCAFAASNASDRSPIRLSTDEVVRLSRLFDERGVQLVSLMTTAIYPFDEFVGLVRAVRSAVSEDMPIMANIGDFDADQAQRLKDAGVTTVYHAVRLGEGDATDIPAEQRFDTLNAARSAGLRISSGIGPVRQNTSASEIAKRTLDVLSYRPVCSGVTALVPVAGTAWQNEPTISAARRRVLSAAFRVAVGDKVPLGGGNVYWVDAGTVPRGTEPILDESTIEHSIDSTFSLMRSEEWKPVSDRMSYWR